MLSALEQFYRGFSIDRPVGNNAFSYDQRSERVLFVPPLRSGSPEELAVGDTVAFCEVSDGKERAVRGLRNFLYWESRGIPVVVFDNHNHAFCFWAAAMRDGAVPFGLPLVHVDQHRDMREPSTYLSPESLDNMENVFRYTNDVLNVGNFIQPALRLEMFSGLDIIDSRAGFEKILPERFVLDLDIDIFSPEMDYIDTDYKFRRIRSYMNKAALITIATSPFFIDQVYALEVARRLFQEDMDD